MKRLLLNVLLSCFVVTLFAQTAVMPTNGAGTAENPYQIESLANLRWLSDNQGYWNRHYIQMADIDATETATWNYNTGFKPLGNINAKFTGSYDGGGYKIMNLTIKLSATSYVGFVGYGIGVTIKNLTIENAFIEGRNYVGGIVGHMQGGSISQVQVTGEIKGGEYVGGIAGIANSVLVENAFCSSKITGYTIIGGIIGQAMGNGTTINNYSTSEIVSSNNNAVMGGVIARVYAADCRVENNYFAGTFDSSSTKVGGIISDGSAPNIDNNNFWDSDLSGVNNTTGSGLAKTSEEMKDVNTYLDAGWIFKLKNSINYGIWNKSDNDYPFLAWQTPSAEGIDVPSEPVIQTVSGEMTSLSEAEIVVDVLYVGNEIATDFGVCYGVTKNPTVANSDMVSVIIEEKRFVIPVLGLEPNNIYYFRAYAENQEGVVYGDNIAIVTVVENMPSGDGTEESPYLISSFSELLWISNNSDSWDKHFVQTDNIDASLSQMLNSGDGFSPIGNTEINFSGSYDGTYHTISDLYINKDGFNKGLFGYAENATIQKLHLKNIEITKGANVGGIAGSVIRSTLYQLSVSGTITGEGEVGGLLGSANYSTIEQCFTEAYIESGPHSSNGGIASYIFSCELIDNYSKSIINSDRVSSSGGISGVNNLETGIVKNNYFGGELIGSGNQIGGLFAYNYELPVSSINFWDSQKSDIINNDISGLPKTTAEMQDGLTFYDAGWNFKVKNSSKGGVWNIGNGKNDGYPYFVWESPNDEGADIPLMAEVSTKSIKQTAAQEVTFNIEYIGNPIAYEVGICYGTSKTPLVTDNTVTSEETISEGDFTLSITDISSEGMYYARAYITNSVGTFYGNVLSFAIVNEVEPAGNGDEESPYLISTFEELYWVSNHSEVWDKYFEQTANIDASLSVHLNNGEGFSPIGIDDENSFTGNYNGNFYKISNLYINRPNNNYQGLFGYHFREQSWYSKSITNLVLENADITGKDYVGGIAGYSRALISRTSFSGSIKGNKYVGGISGSGRGIHESFSEGYIEGDSGVGGVSGDFQNDEISIDNCYSRATISGRESVGGIIGEGPNSEPDWDYHVAIPNPNYFAGIIENATPEHSGAIFGSFSPVASELLIGWNLWDKDLTGIDWGTSGKNYGFTTAEMKDNLTYLDRYWEMLSSRVNAIWDIDSEINDGYPYLTWSHTSEIQDAVEPIAGNGSQESPYQIVNIANLRWLYENEEAWDKHFIQTANIDAKEAKYWNKRNRIGTSQTNFTGSYNGDFNTIDNLIIGLFGVIDNATIEKVVVTNAFYSDYNTEGGIVNHAKNSKISQTSFSGIIYGSSGLGGICGTNEKSIIEESFSDATIYGKHDCIGGIVGRNYDGVVKNNYSTSSFFAGGYESYKEVWYVGGIVGCHESESAIIENNYFAGTFGNGVYDAGGIIASVDYYKYPAVDKGNFWDTEISQVTDNLGNGIGLSSNEMRDLSTYVDAKWFLKYINSENPVWNIGNGENNGYPYLNWQYPNGGYIDIPQIAFVDFEEVDLIGKTTVQVQLNISYVGNPVATEIGVCYAIGGTPTTDDNTTYISSDINEGQLTFEISDIEEGEIYTFRAYAINDNGTSYGEEKSLLILYKQIPEGDGTEESPYLISNFNELYWMSENSASWDKHFLQTADIDAAFSESALSEQGGLNPIGNNSIMFTGHYDGAYKIISNLTINRPNENFQSLFGHIDNAIIEKLQMENVNIQGDYYVGGLVGSAKENNIISQISVTGVIKGDHYVGGVCGTSSEVVIKESFSDATISASRSSAYIGGIVGYNYEGAITNNYSSSIISAISNAYSGGLVGYATSNSTVVNNYFAGTFDGDNSNKGGIIGGGNTPGTDKGNLWDSEISEVSRTVGNGEAKTTEEMTDVTTFINVGWEMKLVNSVDYGVWNIGNGRNNDYPYLVWQYPEDTEINIETAAEISIDEITVITETSANVILNIDYVGNPIATEFGICFSKNDIPTTEDDKQDLSNVSEGKHEFVLDNLEENSGYYFRAYIINDKGISYSDVVAKITVVVDEPKGMGTEEKPYRISSFGDLLWISENGDSWDKHFVQTDDIDASLSTYLNKGEGFRAIGIFTGVYNGGYHVIDNLFINRENSNAQGLFSSIRDDGRVEKLYLNNVNITGKDNVGGLVGNLYSPAFINQVSVTGVVNGTDGVGGIVGYSSGLIEQSYFVGDVSGDDRVGGVAGFNGLGEITNCYSISNLTGSDNASIAGIIGYNYFARSTVINNYFVGTIDCETTRKGGIIGSDNAANISSGNFWDYDVSNLLENCGEGEPISTAEMKTINTYVDAGWEFVGFGGDEIWDVDSEINDGYPYLAWILNEKEDIGVGVIDNSVNNSTISILPNPFTDVVNITGNEINRIKVYTTSGVQLLDAKYNKESEITIQTSDFGQGIYLFVVENGGNVETYKLIKR